MTEMERFTECLNNKELYNQDYIIEYNIINTIRKKRSVNRWVVIVSSFFRCDDENKVDRLSETNENLRRLGFGELYPRNPIDAALYFALKNNMDINQLKKILFSKEFDFDFEQKTTTYNGEISINWLKQSLKENKPEDSSSTILFTKEITKALNSPCIDGEKAFLAYINSEEYLSQYSLVRGTALYYFRKNILKYIEGNIRALLECQVKARECEYNNNDRFDDKKCVEIDNLCREAIFCMKDIPIMGDLLVENKQKNKGENSEDSLNFRTISKSAWNAKIKPQSNEYDEIYRLNYLRRKLDFSECKISLREYARQIMLLLDLDDEYVDSIASWILPMFRGEHSVDRCILCLSMILNRATIPEINQVLSNCGYALLSSKYTNDDTLLYLMGESEDIGIESLTELGVLPYNRRKNNADESVGKVYKLLEKRA